MKIFKHLKYWMKIALSPYYKWMTVFFAIWYYRIVFMTAGGLATLLQAGTLFAMFYLAYKRTPNLIGRVQHTCMPVKTLLLFYFYAFVSFAWAYMPFFSGFLSMQNLLVILILYWFFTRFDTFEGMERGFLTFFLLVDVIDSILWRLLVHPSLFVHQLAVGSVAAMAIAYSVCEYMMEHKDRKRKSFLKKCIGVSLVILILSTSSGANASAIASCSIAFFVSGKIFVCILMLLFAIFLYFNQDMINTLILMVMPGKDMETVRSATGREVIWEVMWELAHQKPLLGWGYACVERVATDVGPVPTPDSHNNYLGFYGSLGIVGCIFAGIHFLSALMYSFARKLKKGYAGLFCATCCAVINGYSYGFLSGKACWITVMYFAVVMLMYFYSRVPSQYAVKRV